MKNITIKALKGIAKAVFFFENKNLTTYLYFSITNNEAMNILYLHGLESKLSAPKRALLAIHGTVYAPDMDYKANQNMIATLQQEYKDKNIDVIIGSSMGGFTGFYLSKLMQTPALLFNPALPYRLNIPQVIPESTLEHDKAIHIVIGAQDDVIKASDNIAHITALLPFTTDLRLSILKELEHSIPVSVFKKEIDLFFKAL